MEKLVGNMEHLYLNLGLTSVINIIHPINKMGIFNPESNIRSFRPISGGARGPQGERGPPGVGFIVDSKIDKS